MTEPEETTTPSVRDIPLSQLVLSGLNVRRTERDVDIAALADDIEARGLKQNLVVTPAHDSTAEAGDDWAYKLEVIAGGRRYQALQLLVARGAIDPDHPVPCLLEPRSEARETSLSENLHRVAMNPADEFNAFAAIVGQHIDGGAVRSNAVELCARRFGKTVAYVEGRLRLSDLAAEILQALREDRIGIEAAKAYATVSDHALQVQVFKEREKDSWGGHKPSTIRERLRGKTVPLTDPRMIYVGVDAYLAAGGRTEVEMFMGTDAEERAIDVSKLEKLAREKAEAEVTALAKKAGYQGGLFAQGTGWNVRWPKPPKDFEKAYDYGSAPAKSKIKKSIAVYAITSDGKGLELAGRFRPAGEQKSDAGAYTPPTAEEIAARNRERGIATIAARLAVGSFAGSPFEGRALWPGSANRWIDPIEHVNEDEVLVAVLVKVSAADIAARTADAATKYDTELAETEAERARQAAAAAEAQGMDLDEAVDDLEDDGQFEDALAS